jgi:protein SCO1/2
MPIAQRIVRLTLLLAVLVSATPTHAEEKYSVKGMVIQVDAAHKTVVVSCDAIPNYMEAMEMPFPVRNAKELEGLTPGAMIQFTLVVERDSGYAEGIQIQTYQGLEVDPLTARRLKLLNKTDPSQPAVKPLAIGQPVPSFTLLDQDRHPVALSKFAGKVVALNFIYTRCPLPDFCFRSSNNFGQLQKRFADALGKDLVLLTVTFDPVHDQPEDLLKYAKIWRASPAWHFLTGPPADIQRLTGQFAVDAFPDEGLMNHSLHTAVIDRKGNLVANLEGNKYTADQLGDLIESALDDK